MHTQCLEYAYSLWYVYAYWTMHTDPGLDDVWSEYAYSTHVEYAYSVKYAYSGSHSM